LKIIIKKPESKYGYMQDVKLDNQFIQSVVEGYYEVFPVNYKDKRLNILCNENGKILKMAPNMIIGYELLVGNIIICGMNEERDDFGDIPITLQEWKDFVDTRCATILGG